MSLSTFSQHIRLKYRLLVEGVNCSSQNEGVVLIRFTSGIAVTSFCHATTTQTQCRLECREGKYFLILEEGEVSVQCHFIAAGTGLLQLDQQWLFLWQKLGSTDDERTMLLQQNLIDAVASDVRIQSIHLICTDEQDEANLAAVQVLVDSVRRHYCIPIHVTMPLLQSEESLDAFSRWGVEVVVFNLRQMAKRQQSRFEVEQMFSRTIRLLKRARDILPLGTMAVQLQSDKLDFDSLKMDLEILIRLGVMPLLGFTERRESMLFEEIERFIELTVYLYHKSIAAGLSDVLFRHLQDVIFPSEGQYLESQISKIKKAMMNLPRTDILSRRPAGRVTSDRKIINWG